MMTDQHPDTAATEVALHPMVRPAVWSGIANTMEDSTGWVMHLSTDGGKSLCGLRLTECMEQRLPQDGDCIRCHKSYNRRWPNAEGQTRATAQTEGNQPKI